MWAGEMTRQYIPVNSGVSCLPSLSLYEEFSKWLAKRGGYKPFLFHKRGSYKDSGTDLGQKIRVTGEAVRQEGRKGCAAMPSEEVRSKLMSVNEEGLEELTELPTEEESGDTKPCEDY